MSMRLSSLTAIAGLALAWGSAYADPVQLDPILSIDTAHAIGVHAVFRSLGEYEDPDGDAPKFSTVYWDNRESSSCNSEGPKPESCYSTNHQGGFEPIGSLDWGTGIWGLNDWTAMQSGTVDGSRVDFHGMVTTINHGNLEYNNTSGPEWGVAESLPDSTPDYNWTAYYTGYLLIEEAGEYNFGVLYDDGFFFTIYGAEGQFETISSDFILTARERLGFDTDLLLSEGLYRFELGAYNRLEAGVVQLAWKTPGEGELTLVPKENLVHVPLPGTAALLALGGLIGWRRTTRA